MFNATPMMTNEEILQEMEEQLQEEQRIGYRDHHFYDDATYGQVETDYTTQS
tara:strand:+ start:2261 stop:2416 length:156 start_codon:yes stop_codon:yes gene_type:complete